MSNSRHSPLPQIRGKAGCLIAVLCLAAIVPVGFAQGLRAPQVHESSESTSSAVDDSSSPEWMARLGISPDSPQAKMVAEQARARVGVEKELKKIRSQHFGRHKYEQRRHEGFVKLEKYLDAAFYPLLIDVFSREDADVKIYLMDRFAAAANPAGDAALAWLAVYDKDLAMRAEATSRIKARLKADKRAVESTRMVVYEGFRSGKDKIMTSSARLASNLNLIELMPWLISAQATGQPTAQTAGIGGGTGSGGGALAWILVGQQTAFVSDLTPVVGPYAVAFDPQLSTITTGTLLRVVDAVVISYHIDIHNTLVDWSTREYGQDTGGLGYDYKQWKTWYDSEFLPFVTAKAKAEHDAKMEALEALKAAKLAPAPTGKP